ncbi:o-succinylbenzoate--CoA ligase [Haloprofundus salinisoli]|uniref:o-succinylbenzoate--CoA ligase n=1 Tax=Haloprofundus salinisoli TaxID=2876193 RepID=UPI001CCCD028|nr:o-succinylbenzoate--CoA ligase [Haloprofundus salinisoli]
MRDWLSHRAQTSPTATAVVVADSGAEWTVTELDAAVEETAGRLAALGVEAGDHLGVLMDSRVAYVLFVHASMRLGATLVPLNDRLTAAELGPQIDHADLTTLVCGETTEETAVEAVERAANGDGDATEERDANETVPLVSVDEPQFDSVASFKDVTAEGFVPAEWERSDPLVLLFTSGTTGDPKAVVLQMGNVLSSAVASAFHLGISPDDRWLVPLSLYHMGGIGPILRGPLYGITVVLREEYEPGSTADDIGQYDITCVSLVPTMLTQMLDTRGTLADSLRVVLLGGAPAPRSLVERCRDYSIPVHPTYGMTETASQIATARPQEAFDNPGTVGRPLYWTQLTVVDGDDTELPPNDVGELVVDGPTVSPGYYGDEATTDEAFGPNGLHTGDVGYRDAEGRVYVLNRLDDRIITGGENVDPGEIVETLRSHPDVADAAVVGVPDDEWGERVAALLVPKNPGLTAEEVESFCRERLAGFKLPRTVEFAHELPRTVSGTVDRAALRDRLDDGVRIEDAESAEPARELDRATDASSGPDRTVADETEAREGDDAVVEEAESVDVTHGNETPEADDKAAGIDSDDGDDRAAGSAGGDGNADDAGSTHDAGSAGDAGSTGDNGNAGDDSNDADDEVASEEIGGSADESREASDAGQ